MKRGKIRTMINFPINDLDLSEFISNKNKDRPIYDLFATCNHNGSLIKGHYYALAKNKITKQFFIFNDRLIKEIVNE